MQHRTETGRLMTSERPPGDLDWNYLRILPKVEPFVMMDEIAPGIYECVALDGLKSKSTINSDDPPNSFRTRDLFTKHPSKPNMCLIRTNVIECLASVQALRLEFKILKARQWWMHSKSFSGNDPSLEWVSGVSV